MSPFGQTLRALRRSPAFPIAAVLTMGLGIAASTALFSIVDAVLLSPLPYPDAARVVALQTRWPAKSQVTNRITGGDLVDLRREASHLSALAQYWGGEIGVRLRDQSRFAQTFFTAPDFFRVLGVVPTAGHLPVASDAGHTAVVSLGFAVRSFGSGPAAIGRVLTVDNRPYDVAAVLPDAYAFPENAEVWLVQKAAPENLNRTAFNYYAIARLRPQGSLPEATAQLANIGSRLARAYPSSNAGKTFTAIPLRDQIAAPLRSTLVFLFAGSGLLLLIACANVAHLSLARTARQTRELAIRLSLGCRASTIFKTVLLESLVLGLASALFGTALAALALRVFVPLVPSTLPHAQSALHLRPDVVLFAGAVSLLTVLASSLAPVLLLPKLQLATVMKESTTRGFAGGRSRTRPLVVMAQIAICTVLCVGAALLARTLLALNQTSLGYRTEHVLVAYADAPAWQMSEYLEAIRTFERSLQNIRELPGVRSAAAVMGLPTGQYGSNGSYLVEGVHIQAGQDIMKLDWPQNLPHATFALASPSYFSTVGIRLISGRDFTPRDQYDQPFTAVVSESLARESFGNASPLGRRLYCGLDSPKPMTIVGVVSDVRQDSPASRPEPEIYMPFPQHPSYANELQIVVRTEQDPQTLAPLVRARIHRIAPFVATRFTTFGAMVQESVAAERFRAVLAIGFAALATCLALGGVYALMSYQVAERTAEIGIRMAVGANQLSIMRLVWARALLLALAGLGLGLVSAVGVSHLAAKFLWGVTPLDATAYAMGVAIMLLIVLAASTMPAWRASQLDPIRALQQT